MWSYNNEPFEIAPEGYVGFVYIIECLPTAQKYIGKKIFLSAKKKAPLKGKTRSRHSKVDSNWKNYFGSSDYIKQLVVEYGKEAFKREILRLCQSKSEMSYYEMREIFVRDALLKDDYINRWVTCQINSKNLEYLNYNPEFVASIIKASEEEPEAVFTNYDDTMKWLND